MRLINLFLSAATIFLCLAACTRPQAAPDNRDDTSEESRVFLCISTPLTKASDNDTEAIAGEVAINTLEIFIFRATDGTDDGMLDAYKKAEAGEIDATTHSAVVSMEATTGRKHIYAIANAPEWLAEQITKEKDLQGIFSYFEENTRSSFLMVGSPMAESVLLGGDAPDNTVDISLRRLVGRVKVEKITGDFSSPAYRKRSFRVKRIYLAFVPKTAPIVNGSVQDVFGTPASFTAAGVTISNYYPFPAPNQQYAELNGSFNPAVLNENGEVVLSDNPNVADLTSRIYTPEEGTLYTLSDDIPRQSGEEHSIQPDLYLYMYPNSSVQATQDGESDFTTKLVIETELDGLTLYYPISLGYTQPNYAYTVNNVTITRLGSTDPNLPVTTAACRFEITVCDWTSGEIIGSFNNQEDGNNFVI